MSSPEHPAPPGFDAGTKTVLVVDDAPLQVEMLREMVARGGFRVISAVGAAEALQAAEQQIPDLVLMDLLMPGVDGAECTRRMKRLPGLAATPFLMVTSSTADADVNRALAAGCIDFLTKPVDEQTLLTKVRGFLGGVRRRRHPRFQASLPVTAYSPDTGKLSGATVDLSDGGLFIDCAAAPEIGATLPLTVALDLTLRPAAGGAEKLDLHGRVAHRARDRFSSEESFLGFGVELIFPNRDAAAQWRSIVRAIAGETPETTTAFPAAPGPDAVLASLLGAALRDDSGAPGVAGVLHDLLIETPGLSDYALYAIDATGARARATSAGRRNPVNLPAFTLGDVGGDDPALLAADAADAFAANGLPRPIASVPLRFGRSIAGLFAVLTLPDGYDRLDIDARRVLAVLEQHLAGIVVMADAMRRTASHATPVQARQVLDSLAQNGNAE